MMFSEKKTGVSIGSGHHPANDFSTTQGVLKSVDDQVVILGGDLRRLSSVVESISVNGLAASNCHIPNPEFTSCASGAELHRTPWKLVEINKFDWK